MLSAFVTGSAYVTEGINNLIQVKDIELSFPGYRDPNDNTDTPIKYIGYRTPMTQDDIASRCNAITGLGGGRPGSAPRGQARGGPSGQLQAHPLPASAAVARPAKSGERRRRGFSRPR